MRKIITTVEDWRFSARFANRWYRNISILYCVSISILGLYYFRNFGSLPLMKWSIPWVCLIVLTSVNLFLSPRFAFVEGAGFPGKVAALRFAQTMFGYGLLVTMLLAGFSLWATIALPLAQATLSFWWLSRTRTVPNFFNRYAASTPKRPEWRQEILNLQWRVALSWLGGYLASVALTPLLFAYQGATVAGRWGLSFSLLSQITALGASWSTAQAPRFGQLIARGDRAGLDRVFIDASTKTVILVSAGCFTLIAAVWVAGWMRLAIAVRVADVGDLSLMAIATIGSAVVFCLATYVRAHKEEPLVASSLIIGGITVVAAWTGAHFSLRYVALVYMTTTIFVSLPWRYAIYRMYRKRPAIVSHIV